MKQHLGTNKQEQGFTLVELLVVIGIIAILTAIAVPMFLSQRQKANDAALRSDMKNVATEIETWYADNPNATITGDPARGAWSIILRGEGGYFGSYTPTSLPVGMDPIPLSNGTGIGVIARKSEGIGNFCILGRNQQSKKYSGESYEHHIYYDSTSGGVINADQLVPTGPCAPYHRQIANGVD